jgi:hypothetical protein
VVPSSAVTRAGLFKTHRVGSKLLYEIPRSALGKEMLVVTQIARNTLGGGYGGEEVGDRVVRWERRGDRVLLRNVSYSITADTSQAIYQAVQQANYDPVIAVFNVEAYGPDSAAVVDVTRLYTTSNSEFGVGNQIRGPLDASRSFVERVAAFPDNVEVEATHTYTVTPTAPPGIPDEFKPAPRTQSVLLHWSMVKLPDRPMMPRRLDTRVGYFSVFKQDFGTTEHRSAERRYITRWRLEKKDPSAAVSEPVKPIVYYIDRATPPEWVPWIKAGVEAWQPAFEAAGFRNAIQARLAPSPQEPDWSAEDARYASVRWLPSTIENAVGPSITDPRTGEILDSDIKMYHNILNLLTDWYFVQAGPLDPRARTLPLPDTLMGKLLKMVVTHEVGHTLGFPHNQKASANYPADSLRSVAFLREWGHTPSIMDYSRFNYVAQPEDRIPLDLLVPRIGPYDVFAVKWGYTPIDGATTPDQERATLDRWAREQDAKPWLRFNTPGTGGADQGDQTEAVGDGDPVQSTALGVRNLNRVMEMLVPAAEKRGEDYSSLSELYGRVVNQWATELNHVVILVGGVESQERYGDGVRFRPLPRARQAAAVRYLNEAAFKTPQFLLDGGILRRIEVEGAMNRITNAQMRIVNSLFNDARMRRLAEYEALGRPGETYGLADMAGDVRRGIWSEVGEGSVRIDPFRRNLQRAFLEALNNKVNPKPQTGPATGFGGGTSAAGAPSEARAVLRGELRSLQAAIRAAIPRASDRATRLHLEDARDRIDSILDPQKP